MLTTTFLADPWIDPNPRNANRQSREWKHNYQLFKSQLYWNTIFYDTTYIQDTYFLFNRQFEFFLAEAYKSERRDQLLFSGQTPAFSCAIRVTATEESLADIYDRELKQNRSFVWYWDGPPADDYIGAISGLIQANSRVRRYDSPHFYDRMHEKLRLALEPDAPPGIYYRARAPRLFDSFTRGKHSRVAQLLSSRSLTRSNLYSALGVGIHPASGSNSTSLLRGLHDSERWFLRTAVDDAYRHTIAECLELPGHYPGFSLPPNHFNRSLLQPVATVNSVRDMAAFTEALRRHLTEHARQLPFAQIEYDLARLPLSQIWALRSQASSFRSKLEDLRIAVERGCDPPESAFLDLAQEGTDILCAIGDGIRAARGEAYYRSALLHGLMWIERQVFRADIVFSAQVLVALSFALEVPSVWPLLEAPFAAARLGGYVAHKVIGRVDEDRMARREAEAATRTTAATFRSLARRRTGQVHSKVPSQQDATSYGHSGAGIASDGLTKG